MFSLANSLEQCFHLKSRCSWSAPDNDKHLYAIMLSCYGYLNLSTLTANEKLWFTPWSTLRFPLTFTNPTSSRQHLRKAPDGPFLPPATIMVELSTNYTQIGRSKRVHMDGPFLGQISVFLIHEGNIHDRPPRACSSRAQTIRCRNPSFFPQPSGKHTHVCLFYIAPYLTLVDSPLG